MYRVLRPGNALGLTKLIILKRTLCIITILLLLLSLFKIYILEVRVFGTDELLYQRRAKLGDPFEVHWTHSVTLQPVIETYKLEGTGKIPLIKMTFNEFGPNLPARPEFNQYWVIEDGKYNVLGYDRVFETVPVTIGEVIANHQLLYNGRRISLKEIYKPGGVIQIGLRKKSLLQYFIEEGKLCLKSKRMISI